MPQTPDAVSGAARGGPPASQGFDQRAESARRRTQAAARAQQLRRQQIQQAVDRLNQEAEARAFQHRFDYDRHEATGRWMVTVSERTTGKVIRQIPPEEILDMRARMEKLIGLIFDQQA